MRGLVFNSMVCVYLLCPQNLFDFALDKKYKSKQKAFATCEDGN